MDIPQPQQPNNLQPNIWETNPTLKTLLLVLIFVFLFSGIGLVVFAQWSGSYRQKVYEETRAALPKHNVKETSPALKQTNQELDYTITDSQISGWKVYVNNKLGFQLEFPEYYSTTGKQATNSTFGSADNPVLGVYVGPFVFVRLNSAELKKQAQGYMEIGSAVSQPLSDGDMPAPVCKVEIIPNQSAEIKFIYCTGEGGPAYYAYIKGKNSEIFVDGYSCGWNAKDCSDVYGSNPGGYEKSPDIKEVLKTFKFIDSVPDISTWKTYKNNEYGFEFKYPGDWITYDNVYYKDSQVGSFYIFQWGIEPPTRPNHYQRAPYFTFSVINNPKSLSLLDFFQEIKNQPSEAELYYPYANIKKLETIKTLSGDADVFIIPGVIGTRHAYIVKGKYIFKLDKPEDLSYTEIYPKEFLLNIFNKIFSTLKFTK